MTMTLFHDLFIYFSWLKKPLDPKVKVHIGCDSVGSAKPLPILAAFTCGDVDGNCVIVYGSLIKPAVEKIVSYPSIFS